MQSPAKSASQSLAISGLGNQQLARPQNNLAGRIIVQCFISNNIVLITVVSLVTVIVSLSHLHAAMVKASVVTTWNINPPQVASAFEGVNQKRQQRLGESFTINSRESFVAQKDMAWVQVQKGSLDSWV